MPEGGRRPFDLTLMVAQSGTIHLNAPADSRSIETVSAPVPEDSIPLSTRSRFQLAAMVAIATDAGQILASFLCAEGALSPADDLLDLAVGAFLVHLLGWHWEFLPTFLAELVPGVDLVPFWTLAVIHVYRKWRRTTPEEAGEQVAAGL